MSIQSIKSPLSSIYSLDEILQDAPETATEELDDIEKTYQSYKEQLNDELKATDRVWLEFQAGHCENYGKTAKSILYRIVKSSIGHPENSKAASNAITILKEMKVSFSCLDLQGVQIPGAELSTAILDRADLSGANLEDVDLRYASLNSTNTVNANLKSVKLDLPAVLFHKGDVLFSTVSPDGTYLVSRTKEHIYFWRLTDKLIIKVLKIEGEFTFSRKTNSLRLMREETVFTPDGRFLFIYDNKQHVDIYSLDDCKHIRKFAVSDEKDSSIYFSFSPNGSYFITYDWLKNDMEDFKSIVKMWKMHEQENSSLDINLENEAIVPYGILDIRFSKKLPIFYCVKGQLIHQEGESKKLRIDLCIWNTEITSEIANIENIFEFHHASDTEFRRDDYMVRMTALDILDTNTINEEFLFIAHSRSIYSVPIHIFKNEQSWSLKSAEIKKIVDEIDVIYNMRVLTKTHELIYTCNNAVCLYSIKNNELVGKYRLYDADIESLPISHDGVNVYIHRFNRILIYSVEALKNSKYSSQEVIDSICSSFSSDMNTILSVSKNCYMTLYDVQTGSVLKSTVFQKIKSQIPNPVMGTIVCSHDNQYIIIYSAYEGKNTSYVINGKNEEIYFKEPVYKVALSNNADYLACIKIEGTMAIYKMTPSKQCIGEFDLGQNLQYAKITISPHFQNIPRIVLSYEYHDDITLYDFKFKDNILDLQSQKQISLRPFESRVYRGNNNPLDLQFIKNSSELIVVYHDKIILCNIEQDLQDHYKIAAYCARVSQDGTLLVFYDNFNKQADNVCLWSIDQKKPLIVQSVSLAINTLQISSDNKYILATTDNGGIYAWEILENSFRLLWRTSHNLQTLGLLLGGNNNLEEAVEVELIKEMGALKITDK